MVIGVVVAAVWIGSPVAYLVAFVVMGPLYVRFAILMHEAAHKLLFTNKRVNDWVGTWLLAYPAFTPISLYRRGHFAHHRTEFGPEEPDLAFYRGYPCTAPDPVAGGSAATRSASRAGRTSRRCSGRCARPPTVGWPVDPRGAGPDVGCVGACHRALVDLPAAVVAAVDDPVARAQPAAGRRRARRDDRRDGPPGDHPPRAPVVAGPAVAGALPHRLAPGPPRGHGHPVAQPAPLPCRARAGRVRHRRLTYPSYLALWKALSSADPAPVGPDPVTPA